MATLYYAETDLIRLRPFRMSDARAIFEYAHDEQVTKFTHWQRHATIDDTSLFLKQQKHYSTTNMLFGIEHKKDKKIIGECGFINIQFPCAEIYYALSRYYWGNGLATHTVHALMEYGFQDLHFERMEAWIIADNIASHRVAQKVGMLCETTLYNHWYTQNSQYDIYVYAKEIEHQETYHGNTTMRSIPMINTL